MKKLLTTAILILSAAFNISFSTPANFIIAKGQQPQITIDDKSIIRIVYGSEDKIYCATSKDNGLTFPDIQTVGEIKDMHLGMSRGPQMATSKNYTLVAAIDKKGAVHIFQLQHKSGKWTKVAIANDISGSAPEGLMSIAADQSDHFYAVWLDIRNDKHNKICFAKTTNQGLTWAKNKIAYTSPDETVCQCCKPTIMVNGSNVIIMFRNWLQGSRDLYLLQSADFGTTFHQPVKLGYGTWKLNACPMDGGGLTLNAKYGINTVWQRQGIIYNAKPGKAEVEIGKGRACNITDPKNPIITWQDGTKLKLKELNKPEVQEVGEGSFIKAARGKGKAIFCTWEQGEEIAFKKI